MLESLVNDYLPNGKNGDPSLDIRARQSAGKIPHHLVLEILTGHTLEYVQLHECTRYGRTPLATMGACRKERSSRATHDNKLASPRLNRGNKNVGLYPVWAF